MLIMNVMVGERRRRSMLITPCKRSAARGREYRTITHNPYGVELLHIALLRSTVSVTGHPYPELRLRLARGYSHSTPSVCRLTFLSSLKFKLLHKTVIGSEESRTNSILLCFFASINYNIKINISKKINKNIITHRLQRSGH